MKRVVAIKFRDAGKLYDFEAGDLPLVHGSQVVVETDRGRTLGTVVLDIREIPDEEGTELKKVLRIATDEDRASAQRYAARDREAFKTAQSRIMERNMEMKLVLAEHLFDGSKIIFYFTADGRVDFRELVKDLAHQFHTRIEMRQIGVRDEAKLVGGIGICGRELCCSTFLRDFDPVSVKMAKEQGLALNPSKISGQCGRLLCCLGYEYKTYCSLRKQLPGCGKKVDVDGVEAEVISQNVIRQTVNVRMPDNRITEWPERKKKTDDEAEETAVTTQEPAQRPTAKPEPKPRRETPLQPREGTDEGEQKRSRRRPSRRRGKGGGTSGEQGTQQQAPPKPKETQQPRPPKETAGEGGSGGDQTRKKPRRRFRGKGKPPAKSE